MHPAVLFRPQHLIRYWPRHTDGTFKKRVHTRTHARRQGLTLGWAAIHPPPLIDVSLTGAPRRYSQWTTNAARLRTSRDTREDQRLWLVSMKSSRVTPSVSFRTVLGCRGTERETVENIVFGTK